MVGKKVLEVAVFRLEKLHREDPCSTLKKTMRIADEIILSLNGLT